MPHAAIVTSGASVPFAGELWSSLGGSPELLDHLSVRGSGDFPSMFPVASLAAASVGVASLAAAELIDALGLADGVPAVEVDRLLASAWFGSAVRPVGWQGAPVWDDVTRNYRCAGFGWLRIHANVPQHRRAALGVLGFDDGADPADVRRIVGRWDAAKLEDSIVAAGGVASRLRTREEWLASPQGAAVAAEPLVHWRGGGFGARGAEWTPSRSRPLAGLRVLDLTRVIAGPVSTRFLAGLGADVLRIDPPWWSEVALEPNMTLGKRSARLDARTEEGIEVLRQLLSEADVLVHGYRAGALDALGLDAATLEELRPGLVQVSLTAFGFSGPWAGRRGFDSIVQLANGLSHAGRAWSGADEPQPLPVQALDHSSGYLMAASVLRGLSGLVLGGRGSSARTSLARVGELLAGGEPVSRDGEFDQWAGSLLPAESAWGAVEVLPAPAVIEGVDFSFERMPAPLGSHPAEW